MRFTNKNIRPTSEWESWFAWRPIWVPHTINGQRTRSTVWLERVSRRWLRLPSVTEGWWDYRTFGDDQREGLQS